MSEGPHLLAENTSMKTSGSHQFAGSIGNAFVGGIGTEVDLGLTSGETPDTKESPPTAAIFEAGGEIPAIAGQLPARQESREPITKPTRPSCC